MVSSKAKKIKKSMKDETLKKQAVIYCRVSTMEQVVEGMSLTVQDEACSNFVEKNGGIIAKKFHEEGESGAIEERTQLKELQEYCRRNEKYIDRLIVYKVDRLSRDTGIYMKLRHFMYSLGIRIVSVTESFEDAPAGRYMEIILAGQAQFDNENRAERCKGGMVQAVKSGRFVWKAPVGYKNTRIVGYANIVIDKEKAPLVKRIFSLVASDSYSLEEVRKMVNDEGFLLPNGRKLSRTYLDKILKNRVYTGMIERFGLAVKGDFEPVISEELFEKTQFVLDKHKRNITGYKKENPDFPLSGFVADKEGRKLVGSWSKGNGGRYAYYRFRQAKGFNKQKKAIEDGFVGYLNGFRHDEEYLSYLKEAIGINWTFRNESIARKRKQLHEAIDDARIKQNLIAEKNLKGVIPDDLAKEKIESIKAEMRENQSVLDNLPNIAEELGEVTEWSLGQLCNLGELWVNADIATRKKLQWFFFPSGVSLEGEKFRTTQKSLLLEKISFLEMKNKTLVAPRGVEPLLPG